MIPISLRNTSEYVNHFLLSHITPRHWKLGIVIYFWFQVLKRIITHIVIISEWHILTSGDVAQWISSSLALIQ